MQIKEELWSKRRKGKEDRGLQNWVIIEEDVGKEENVEEKEEKEEGERQCRRIFLSQITFSFLSPY